MPQATLQKNILHYPQLDTILMVEEFIRNNPGEYKRRSLWQHISPLEEMKSEIKFAEAKTEKALRNLRDSKTEDKKLHKWIYRAFEDLQENAFCGIHAGPMKYGMGPAILI